LIYAIGHLVAPYRFGTIFLGDHPPAWIEPLNWKKRGGYPVMKTCALLCLMTIGLSANAQDKPASLCKARVQKT
jgi:hypothetical protein